MKFNRFKTGFPKPLTGLPKKPILTFLYKINLCIVYTSVIKSKWSAMHLIVCQSTDQVGVSTNVNLLASSQSGHNAQVPLHGQA